MDTVNVQQVIVCTKGLGSGKEKNSPIRVLTEVFDFDGNLIAENDVYNANPETILDFLRYHYKNIPDKEHKENIFQYFIEVG